MDNAEGAAVRALLGHLYPASQTRTLQEALALFGEPSCLPTEDDCSCYRRFCGSTLVALQVPPSLLSSEALACLQPSHPAASVPSMVTEFLMCLSLVYNTASCCGGDFTGMLQGRVGVTVLEFLLQHSSIFIYLANGNYIQLHGSPIYKLLQTSITSLDSTSSRYRKRERKRKREVPSPNHDDSSPGKRLKSLAQQTLGVGGGRETDTTMEITLGHPKRKKRKRRRRRKGTLTKSCLQRKITSEGREVRTLLHSHVSKVSVCYSKTTTECFTQKYVLNETQTSAKRLAARIFQSNQLPKKVPRTPQRLRKSVVLLQQILANHRNCQYPHLLQHYCPLPKNWQSPECYCTDLTSVAHPPEQVHAFLTSVLCHIVPMAMWGSEENRDTFFAHLREFIGLRKYEQVSLRELMCGMKLSHCQWLMVPAPGHRHGNNQRSLNDSLKETELFAKFLLWLMKEVVVETIKSFFYVTEHASYANRTLFFRKRVWTHVCRHTLKDKRGTMFSPVDEDEVKRLVLNNATLGVSRLRFLPKPSGVRIIASLGTKGRIPVARQQTHPAVNHQLQNVFHVLSFEKNRKPESVGCLATTHSEIHKRLKEFKSTLVRSHNDEECGRPLFVHVDILKCFDSIIPDKLFDILQTSILTEESYLLRRYATVTLSRGCIRRNFHRAASTRAEHGSFFQFASALSESGSLKNSIIVDMVAYPVESRARILQQLRSHLYANIVQNRRQYFRQSQGIPQGSVLSQLLCSFYYGDMERKVLPKVDPDKGVLLRYVDDFLLITRSPQLAREFLANMNRGVPEYNCYVNTSKTETNFEVASDGSLTVKEEVQYMKLCGLLIDTQSLDVQYDYSRYDSTSNIRDHMTVTLHSHPFHSLLKLTKRAIQLRCRPLLLDCKVLSEKTVMKNIYHAVLLTAVKFCANVRALDLGGKPLKYTLFFHAVVMKSLDYFHRMAVIRCSSAGCDTSFTIPKPLCVWLGCYAFAAMLKRRGVAVVMRRVCNMLERNMSAICRRVGINQIKKCLRAAKRSDKHSKHIFRLKF